jgi:hypothetical protein
MTSNALINRLTDSIRQLLNKGTKKSEQMLGEFSLLVKLLPVAGFEIIQLDVVLSLIPTATIQVKAKSTNQEKLDLVLHENKDKKLVWSVLNYLSQANQLSNSVNTIELKEVKIVVSYTPNVTMHWTEKAELAAVAAA